MCVDTVAHQLCHRLSKHSEQQLGLIAEAAHQLLQMLQFKLVFGAVNLQEQLQQTDSQPTGAKGMQKWRNRQQIETHKAMIDKERETDGTEAERRK